MFELGKIVDDKDNAWSFMFDMKTGAPFLYINGREHGIRHANYSYVTNTEVPGISVVNIVYLDESPFVLGQSYVCLDFVNETVKELTVEVF